MGNIPIDAGYLARADDRAAALAGAFSASAALCFSDAPGEELGEYARQAIICKALTVCLAAGLGFESLTDGTFEETIELLRAEISELGSTVQ